MTRQLFTWFLAFGILLGLQLRAFAGDPCEVLITMHEQEHSDHDHGHEQPCDPSHDEQCPLEHHQQGMCSHAMPMAADAASLASIGRAAFSLTPVREDVQRVPEGPWATLDKPPLN